MAVDGLHQANDAISQIVVHVADVKDILAQHPHAAGPYLAPANQEIDVLERNARERKSLDRGHRHVRPPPTDAPYVKSERRKVCLELELGHWPG